ncbi:hypothetical protein ACFYWD_04130 [Streptomyces sp. NPDC003781]|uniref:hypothetical protein n=1 Tax=Streptomyces sp. NPDC003781 TaxID=3364686 RepID=UPI00369588D6
MFGDDAAATSPHAGELSLVCCLHGGDRGFETFWTKRRGAEAADYGYALMDLTVFGRQEDWEESPDGRPRLGQAAGSLGGAPDWPPLRVAQGGRPTAQWPRVDTGHSPAPKATSHPAGGPDRCR